MKVLLDTFAAAVEVVPFEEAAAAELDVLIAAGAHGRLRSLVAAREERQDDRERPGPAQGCAT